MLTIVIINAQAQQLTISSPLKSSTRSTTSVVLGGTQRYRLPPTAGTAVGTVVAHPNNANPSKARLHGMLVNKAIFLPLLLPIVAGIAWLRRKTPNRSQCLLAFTGEREGLRHQELVPIRNLDINCHGSSFCLEVPTKACHRVKTSCTQLQATVEPSPEQESQLPRAEDMAIGVTAQEYVTHYIQNVAQFFVPMKWEDNIPVVSVFDIFKWGAVDIPMERLLQSKLTDVFTGGFQDITGVPVFILLHRYMALSPIYKLCIGPRSVVVISDAVAVKHILRSEVGKYDKGILAEVLKPIMGKGLIPADTITWLTRRRQLKPAFHQKWLHDQLTLYSTVGNRLVAFLAARPGQIIDMQERFCSASLDIIGKAVFNYEFGSITRESPVIQAVYAVMREAERRASSIVPYWQLPGGTREFDQHMKVLDDVLTSLVEQCVQQVSTEEDEEPQKGNNSLLRFLVEARGQDVTNQQLRDDLMTMLIAGHETTAATLTWALHELTKPENRDFLKRVKAEVDSVLGLRDFITLDDVKQMPLVRYSLVEALRLYPAPPMLIRRCLKEDHLTGVGPFSAGMTIKPGQDVMLATWSLNRDQRLWGPDADKYNPLRFYTAVHGSPEYKAAGWAGFDPARVRGLYPDENAADFGFIPFGGGGRKCMGDQFAILESSVLLSMLLRDFSFEAADTVTLGMGATIFAKEGLMMKVTARPPQPPDQDEASPVAVASDALLSSVA
eukprot:EG_transcript_1207